MAIHPRITPDNTRQLTWRWSHYDKSTLCLSISFTSALHPSELCVSNMSIASLISGVDLTQVLMELENGNLTTAMVAKMLASSSPQLASTLSAMSTEQLITIIKALDSSEDVNVGTNMLRTVWVLLAISTLVLIARLAVKLRTVRRVYYDDAIIIAALVSLNPAFQDLYITE